MVRARTHHICDQCGAAAAQWSGRCPGCGGWNSLVEETISTADPCPAAVGAAAVSIVDVDPVGAVPVPTGLDEADRVLGGGLVPGSVTLLAGAPGVGKSTLLTQVVGSRAERGLATLWISAEESAPQLRARAERLGALDGLIQLANDTSLAATLSLLDRLDPDLVVVDSIQTIHDPALSSAPGSVAQVRHCAHRLAEESRRRGVAIVLVGHITKDGAVAGPRVLEHLVDTVLEFEGDRQRGLRLLRATKHRFGATDEIGLFEMGPSGLASVLDPSAGFLADRVVDGPGSLMVAAASGPRPLLIELQALVGPTSGAAGRFAHGIARSRLDLVLAVLGQHLDLPVHDREVHAALVGGVHLDDPGLDLPLALAVSSSLRRRPLPDDLVAFGEIGLAGELRRVPHTDRRLAEAARLGLRRAVVPRDVADVPDQLEVRRVATVADALRVVQLAAA